MCECVRLDQVDFNTFKENLGATRADPQIATELLLGRKIIVGYLLSFATDLID
jgi:hypothetical protein